LIPLYFKKDSPKVVGKVENVSINQGSNAEFTCKFLSSPAATSVKWYKNDSDEIILSDQYEIITDETSTVLKKINCQPNDSIATYIVKITNELGETSSNKATLNVTRGPVFEVEPFDQKALKDKEAKFECIIKANPKPNIIWLMNDKEITAKDGIRVEKDANKDKYSIIIPKVTSVASFTIKASNEFGTIEKTVQLDVLEGPKALNKLENITVNEGEQAKYILKVSGKPKPSVKWFRDEEEIVINEEYEIIESEEESVLIIRSCKSPNNNGNYYAKVANEFGEVVTNKSAIIINSKFKF
jgi:sporulation protein YlmC with PRC-barrel domain